MIMIIFSFAVTFSMYFVSLAFPGSDEASQAEWNASRISSLRTGLSDLQNLNNNTNPNPALLFGDFLVGVKVLFNMFTLGDITNLLTNFPFWNDNMNILIQIMYGSACVVLWVYVVANRSL